MIWSALFRLALWCEARAVHFRDYAWRRKTGRITPEHAW